MESSKKPLTLPLSVPSKVWCFPSLNLTIPEIGSMKFSAWVSPHQNPFIWGIASQFPVLYGNPLFGLQLLLIDKAFQGVHLPCI